MKLILIAPVFGNYPGFFVLADIEAMFDVVVPDNLATDEGSTESASPVAPGCWDHFTGGTRTRSQKLAARHHSPSEQLKRRSGPTVSPM